MADAVFAMVRDSETIVVNLSGLKEPVTIDELCDLLGLSHGEFIDALDREGNANYRLALYDAAWTILGGEVRDSGTGRQVLLPQAGTLAPEQLTEWLGYVVGEVWFPDWELPAGDFEVPRNPALLRQLGRLEDQRPDPMVWFDVVAYEGADATIAELKRRVDELAKVVKARREQVRGHVAGASSLERARSLVALQREHWKSEGRRTDASAGDRAAYQQRDMALQAVDMSLGIAADVIRAKAVAKKAFLEQQHAEALIALFVEGNGEAAPLTELLEVYAQEPNVLTGAQRENLESALRDAFSLLAASVLVDRFLRNHFLPLFEVFCDRTEGGARIAEVLAEAKAAEAAKDIVYNWKEAIQSAGDAAIKVVTEPTTLKVLNDLGSGYKAVAGVIAAGLNEQLIGRFLYLVNLANNDIGFVKGGRGAWSVATALMRYIGQIATPQQAASGEFGKLVTLLDTKKRYDEILDLVWEASQAEDERVRELARQGLSQTLRVSDGFLRGELGIALAGAIDAVAFLYALRNDDGDGMERAFNLASSLTSATVGTALKTLEWRVARDIIPSLWEQTDEKLEALQRGSKFVSGFVSILGFSAALRTVYRKSRRGSQLGDMWLDTTNLLAQSASAAAFIADVAGAATMGAGLGMVGAVLGVGVLLVAVTRSITETGCGPLFGACVDFAAEIGEQLGAAREFKSLAAAVEYANDASAFSVFNAPFKAEGRRGDGRTMKGAPTWHRVAELGFSPREVAAVFNDGAARISMATAYGEEPGEPA